MLNKDHDIVRIPNEKAGPTQARLHFLFKPHVKHMVEIDVRQRWGYYPALWRSFLAVTDYVAFYDSCIQPFPYQSHQSTIIDP